MICNFSAKIRTINDTTKFLEETFRFLCAISREKCYLCNLKGK